MAVVNRRRSGSSQSNRLRRGRWTSRKRSVFCVSAEIENLQEVLQRIETALAKKNDKQLTDTDREMRSRLHRFSQRTSELPRPKLLQLALQDLSSEYYTLIPHDFGFKVHTLSTLCKVI